MPTTTRRFSPRGRSGRTTLQDALVFVVIALVALVLIMGVVLSGAYPLAQTVTETRATTVTDPPSGAVSTVVVTSDGTSTVTATSDQTATLTSTSTSTSTDTLMINLTSTSTSTSTYTTTDSATTTVTSTTTSTSTTTVTSVVDGPFVVILQGASQNMSSQGFSPDSIVVVIGTNNTVTWINEDSAHQTVTSTSSVQPFNSGDLAPNQSFTFTFTHPGRYTYVSAYYPWMTGVVTVRS